jgi:hypothetical protein
LCCGTPGGAGRGGGRGPPAHAELGKAAAGADPADVAIALRMVLMLESVECRLQ